MNSPDSDSSLSRRALLKGLVAAGAIAALPRRVLANVSDGRAAILRYLAAHRRSDHGYGFEDQARSHLTPTFAVIGSYRLLGETPPDSTELIDFVRTRPPSELKKLTPERRTFDFQQVQSLVWLGDTAEDFREGFSHKTAPLGFPKIYERHGYPVFQAELATVHCHALLGLPLAPLEPAFSEYILARRRANGSFNNTLASDGGDGHVMNTLWALQAVRTLKPPDGPEAELVAWLRSAQLPGGGFTFQPQPLFGGVDDVAYTWAAVCALKILGSAPADHAACVAWIHSLANADGGFGDRPGWASNPMATYRALDALDALGALNTIATVRRAPRKRVVLPANLRIFSLQLEAHGTGSPAEAVALAGALRIDLWGAKNSTPAWMNRAQALAAEQKVPVRFFAANEEHGAWIDVPGLGTYSHMSDVFAPAGVDFGSPVGMDRNSAAAVSWADFRQRRLDALTQAHGGLVWQFCPNEEITRILLDDSVERGGYAAISTFHFGNPDFLNSEPFLQRWRGQIPYVALQDAHGAEPWWFADSTVGFRTLFLATEPTWDGWLNALNKNWTVAVRHDALSRGETWMHAGSAEVLDFVREREATWRWWGDAAVRRPPVSLVTLTPADTLEVGRPEKGVALRIRCAWKNTALGLPQSPLTGFVNLTVDGREVATTLVEKKRPKGEGLADRYHYATLPAPTPGRHSATVTVRDLGSGRIATQSVQFGTGSP